MEGNLPPDDPPESHEDAEKCTDFQREDILKDHTCFPSKDLAIHPPETAYGDQCDEDETSIEEPDTENHQIVRKASKKSSCKMQQGAIFTGKILSFCCSECKGDATYSPNDLLKHFQGTHKGTLPTYPCDLCSFVTNEFSSLQRHRIGHRNTLVTCEICNDGVQYSLLLLTRHFIMCHSRNGHFHCEKCEFSTRDAGTFVQHIHHHNEGKHKCVKCQHVSSTWGELQRHILSHTGTFPFSCQFCGYGAARKEYLSKHMISVHSEEMDRMNRWRSIDDNTQINSPGLKLLLKKGPAVGGSREPQWMSKLHSLPGVGLLDQNGKLLNPEKTLEETQQFLERAVGVKKESSKWSKGALKSEPQCSYPVTSNTPQPKVQETDLNSETGLLNPGNSNGLTVLMVKNKISIPPNCTTKVMGFKMVDGKKHLVLKVIPTKQEPSCQNEEPSGDACNAVGDTGFERKYSDTVEDCEMIASSPPSTVSQGTRSLFSPGSGEASASGANKELSATIKVEALMEESLLEEAEKDLRRTKSSKMQICDEGAKRSNMAPPSASASPGVDVHSLMTKESNMHMGSNGQSSTHVQNLLPLHSGAPETQKPNSLDSKLSPCDSAHSDSLVAETKLSISVAENNSVGSETRLTDSSAVESAQLNSDIDETIHSDSVVSDTAHSPPPVSRGAVSDEDIAETSSDATVSKTTHPDLYVAERTTSNPMKDDITPSDAMRGDIMLSTSTLDETESTLSVQNGSLDHEITVNNTLDSVGATQTDSSSSSLLKEKPSPLPDPTLDGDLTGDPDPSKCTTGEGQPFHNHEKNFTSTDSVCTETLSTHDNGCETDSIVSENCQPCSKNSSADGRVLDLITKETTESDLITETELMRADVVDAHGEKPDLNSPRQEVFSFHNYSKETAGSSPSSLQTGDLSPLVLEEEGYEEDGSQVKVSTDMSLTPLASPSHDKGQSEEKAEGSSAVEGIVKHNYDASPSFDTAMERVSDSDIEVDECIATVDDSAIPLQPESETLKAQSAVEEGGTAIGEKDTGSTSNASALGKILEKHSDAIISQQLEKERLGSSATPHTAVRPAKTMLRILQTPEGKQQMFLQTAKTPYAVPVQLKSRPGFKLITKACASKINVSYVKPGIARPNKSTGLALTLNGGRIGMSAQSPGGEKSPACFASVTQASGSSKGHYLVNASALKAPVFLSDAVKSSGEQTTNTVPTCYLVQRPVPGPSVADGTTGSGSKTLLTSRPVLAVPVSSAEKSPSTLHSGRQAYLVRYISPAKSGILLNNSDSRSVDQSNQPNECSKNRVFLKIVSGPNGTRFLSNAPCPPGKKPVYISTASLQSPCFLMSSSKSFVNVSTGLRTLSAQHSPSDKPMSGSQFSGVFPLSTKQISVVNFQRKSQIVPNQTRQLSQRKRKRRTLFEEYMESSPKSRKVSRKVSPEKEGSLPWEPVAKDVERTLRLSPFSPLQQIKCPRRNQPVVVLNHPDADIPEVASIMKSVNRYKGEVHKVALSKRTVKALSELSLTGVPQSRSNQNPSSVRCGFARKRPLESSVRERFILRLKLKKTSRNRYQVVKSSSAIGTEQATTFGCWFCGRVFNNQEDWIGHGQRHLMEATRDWNKLF